MRIPIFFNPINKNKYFLYIERAYKSEKRIIPLGHDCHPAYVLQKLHLRKCSMPFDWLNNDPLKAIEYINSNMKNDFSFFMKDLTLNEKGNVIASEYPYCEFLHEPNLIESSNDRAKFKRRITRFKDVTKIESIHYINTIGSLCLNSNEKVEYFVESVRCFVQSYLKKDDLLSIYTI